MIEQTILVFFINLSDVIKYLVRKLGRPTQTKYGNGKYVVINEKNKSRYKNQNGSKQVDCTNSLIL